MSTHAATGAIDHHHDHTTATGIPNKKLFMWAFLASDCMFFGALISTHLIYRLHPTPGSPDPKKLFSLDLTLFATFVLLISSLLVALAVNATQKSSLKSVRRLLLGTIFFGLIFLSCQVFEYGNFLQEGLTLSSSMFGTTFYTLTGTHGCHVAIGVLWLTLMYIRTFKPADESPWILRSLGHLLVFAVVVVAGVISVVSAAHGVEEHGFALATFAEVARHHLAAILVTAGGLAVLAWLGRTRAAVDFDERNAIDVESLGLYWHFIDIVWIVIFTVVYLLEFL
ncbi:MAG: heme-copper oxidase subunit III [Verrucomicrobia bacterium]|nr:heme-copper oxidase subunit III [Verrucomicrobiota bacterium]